MRSDLILQVTKLGPIRSIMAVQRNRSKVVATLAVGAVLCALNSMSPIGWVYNLHQRNPATSTTYWADVGYFADGTSYIKAGNCCNHGPPTVPDPHMNGSPLPPSQYVADCGHFVDGTDITKAGNALNHAR